MPATITHAFFAVDVYNKLKNEKVLKAADLGRLKMFAQSTDSMMFYNIESLMVGKKIRQFQYQFHTSKTQDFFISLCTFIKNNNLINHSEIRAFLYGFICHYVLDSTLHPFIIYKTGIMKKGIKETYKYNNLHSYMEIFLDNVMIGQKSKDKLYSFRLDKYCFDTRDFSEDLNMVIDKVFSDVFHINNMSKIYFKSLKQMKRFLKHYRYDKYGIKLFGYKMIDLFTCKSMFKFRSLSYHYHTNYEDYFLNTEHQIWYNPINNKISSHDSFFDLYNKALREACFIIKCVNKYFEGINIDLKKSFTNKSYLSGLDCDIPLDFKNFYF